MTEISVCFTIGIQDTTSIRSGKKNIFYKYIVGGDLRSKTATTTIKDYECYKFWDYGSTTND